MIPLPVDAAIGDIRAALRQFRAVVVTAEPGAGKTTRVPPSLLDAGAVVLLQPRRVAVRAVATRIASERGWTIGREIGWHIRLERRASVETRLLVVTEGILTARFQADPLLTSVNTVVVDEFHERGIHADLALAFSAQAWRAREDLRIVVMSATLDAGPVARFLGGCPVVNVPGRQHALEIEYAPGETVARAAIRVSAQTDGDVLCFLPGAFDIQRTVAEIASFVDHGATEVLALHGSLSGSDQDRALSPSLSGSQRIVVATNVAETSVTVPGVRAVVDSGLHKVARYDSERGIDSLVTERITQDSADQRAGRAGRTATGRVLRIWDARDRLQPHREPEIYRVDLAGAVLDVLGWGGHPRTFEWFESPKIEALEPALDLLRRLGAHGDEGLSAMGHQMRRLPLNPRLSRMLIEAQGAWTMVQACALLSERSYLAPRGQATTADLLSAIDHWDEMPFHVKQVAADLERLTRVIWARSTRTTLDDRQFRRALLTGYPDRVAQRREPGSSRLKLSSGTGAVLGSESGVVSGDLLLAIDVHGARTTESERRPKENTVRIAARLEPEWISPTHSETRCWLDEDLGTVRGARIERYDALVLSETPVVPDEHAAAAILADAWLRRGPSESENRLLSRLKFAGHAIDLPELVKKSSVGHRRLGEVNVLRALEPALLRSLDRDAPETLPVPSGRSVTLEYGADGTVSASVKLQELFGLAETPRIGRRQEPVLLALLAPNGRPVQMTRDLRSFWTRTYPEVRRELRGRYPKHPWPEDPWQAPPTARTKRRSR